MMEIIYVLPDVPQKQDNGRYAAIDIGGDNLAAMALNVGQSPFLFRGTPLKAINTRLQQKSGENAQHL